MDMVKIGMNEVSKKISGIDIYQITGVNVADHTYTIKQLNFNKVYNNISAIGCGLGHGKGQLKLLNENDLVLVANIMGDQQFYIIGSIFNDYMGDDSDTKLQISKDEYFVNNKANGSFLYIKSDNSVRLLNDEGYGFEIDSSGNITIRGKTITHTQTPRT